MTAGSVVTPVLASPLTCPTCGAVVHEVTIREGQAWVTCTADLRGRPGGDPRNAQRQPCGAHWLNITLPGNLSAVEALRARYGDEIAEALATAGGMTFRDPPAPTPGHPVIHVQVPTARRVEHVFRYLTLSGLLRAVGLMAARPPGA